MQLFIVAQVFSAFPRDMPVRIHDYVTVPAIQRHSTRYALLKQGI